MPRSAFAYLYVIASDAFDPLGSCVKIGHSVSPPQRRSQLQTGNTGKLTVQGQWRVAAADASRFEASVKEALRPLKVKGEVFRASEPLACAVVKWIAEGHEPDAFIRTAVEHEAATLEWSRIDSLPSAHGRWATEETKEAAQAAWTRVKALGDQMLALDPDRAAEADPFSAASRAAKKEGARRDRV